MASYIDTEHFSDCISLYNILRMLALIEEAWWNDNDRVKVMVFSTILCRNRETSRDIVSVLCVQGYVFCVSTMDKEKQLSVLSPIL